MAMIENTVSFLEEWYFPVSAFCLIVVYPLIVLSPGFTGHFRKPLRDVQHSTSAAAAVAAAEKETTSKPKPHQHAACGSVRGLILVTAIVASILIGLATIIQVGLPILGWTEAFLHGLQVKIMFVSALGSFLGCLFVTSAPYGKHAEGGPQLLQFGPLLPAKACWVLMECPTLVLTAVLVWVGPSDCLRSRPSNLIILGLFVLHYIQRSLIYPFRIRGGAPMPTFIFTSALTFCAWNGYLQVRDLTHLSCQSEELFSQSDVRLWNPAFYFGVALFLAGFSANLHSDAILRNLRKPGETGYKIPRGGLFEYVSGANFAAEIFEWLGFAIAAGTPTAWCFAVFTFSNIAPRAHAHHQWYLKKFKDDYPANRKAVIPFIW